jgi:hypothetical protein
MSMVWFSMVGKSAKDKAALKAHPQKCSKVNKKHHNLIESQSLIHSLKVQMGRWKVLKIIANLTQKNGIAKIFTLNQLHRAV